MVRTLQEQTSEKGKLFLPWYPTLSGHLQLGYFFIFSSWYMSAPIFTTHSTFSPIFSPTTTTHNPISPSLLMICNPPISQTPSMLFLFLASSLTYMNMNSTSHFLSSSSSSITLISSTATESSRIKFLLKSSKLLLHHNNQGTLYSSLCLFIRMAGRKAFCIFEISVLRRFLPPEVASFVAL